MGQQTKSEISDPSVATMPGRTYQGTALRHVAMPLGGIGTGQISLCGDGGLRQWEIFNHANHLAFVPDSFFAISTATETKDGPRQLFRILQSQEVLDFPEEHTPMIDDDIIPDEQRALVEEYQGVQHTSFTGAYPFARVTYLDDDIPLDISLEAFSPFIPLDNDASSIPAIIFTFRLHNTSPEKVSGGLDATLKNVVGWDGLAPISGNRCALFGGNTNRLTSTDRYTCLIMENPSLPDDHPGHGQMALSTPSGNAQAAPRWKDVEEFMHMTGAFNAGAGAPEDVSCNSSTSHPPAIGSSQDDDNIPSNPGETWNGGLQVPYSLEPGQSTEIDFILAWSFPNRYVNFDQATRSERPDFQKSRLWLGNAYSTRFSSALDTIDHVVQNQTRLEDDSRLWSNALLSSTLPTWLAEFLAAQGALIRSPTVFQSDDDKLYGFEGTKGASTSHGYGGSCPLNCTHVWNYEQAISRLFPRLEQTMRETDFDYAQAPEGYIPHRTMVPLFIRQLWDEPIGESPKPAIDGMLGTILKVYREVRQGADEAWLGRYWPKVKLLLSYIEQTWDSDGDGVLAGQQPNTYDIAFYGTNMFIGGLWLAVLRATEELARIQHEDAFADDLHERFTKARDRYDRLLWNGEYYIQILGKDDPREQQYLTGCLSDQLLGQWWAHQLDLGYILPETHVRKTLQSIVRYNFREDFNGWVTEERIFAHGNDQGLLNMSWPDGGRPERPTRYHDEVWTGVEYQVAAHCIMEGLSDEGMHLLKAARGRYSGDTRNPYNDIECGDHYARAMSGWSVIEALSGYRYNAVSDSIEFGPVIGPDMVDKAGTFRVPFVTASGWGKFELAKDEQVTITALHGELRMRTLVVPASIEMKCIVTIGGKPIKSAISHADGRLTIAFPETINVRPGELIKLIDESVPVRNGGKMPTTPR